MNQILKCSESMQVLIDAIKFVLNIIRWAIPIVLIVLGSIDMFKAMANNDDKKAGEAKSTFIRRLIYAVVAFLIPFLVTLAFDIVGGIVTNDGTDIHNQNLKNGNFFECWYKNSSSNNGTKTSQNDDKLTEEETKMVCCYICEDSNNCDHTIMSDQECFEHGGEEEVISNCY